MARSIVVAFRMPLAGAMPGPEGTYLPRARAIVAHADALGGRLVAWSTTLIAFAWELDSMEEAVMLAKSIPEEAPSPERTWACGIAEGEIEGLAEDGSRGQLAWGEALTTAAALARLAMPGEALVDGDVKALRAGHLQVLGPRASTDAGQRVRGMRLDLESPWKRDSIPGDVPPVVNANSAPIAAPPVVEPAPDVAPVVAPDAEPARPQSVQPVAVPSLVEGEPPVLEFPEPELSTSDVVQAVEATATSDAPASPERAARRELAERVRKLVHGDESRDSVEALAELRRLRSGADGDPPAARCQASVALAMTLAMTGRPEEALLEAVDALARARQAQDAKAVGACMALLAKLYATAGRDADAAALRGAAGVG